MALKTRTNSALRFWRLLETRQKAALVVLGVLGCAMLWLPLQLLAGPPPTIKELNGILLQGNILAAAATFIHASLTFSPRQALILLGASATMGLAAEMAGGRVPIFGATYTYHEHLWPRLFDAIPLFVPLAWFVLSFQALVALRPFLLGRPANPLAHSASCALLLTCYDLMIDPLATALGIWTWHTSGLFFGVPVFNFLGWFAVGFCIYYLMFQMTPFAVGRQSLFSRLVDGLAAFVVGLILLISLGIALRVVNEPLFFALGILVLFPMWVGWAAHLMPRRRHVPGADAHRPGADKP